MRVFNQNAKKRQQLWQVSDDKGFVVCLKMLPLFPALVKFCSTNRLFLRVFSTNQFHNSPRPFRRAEGLFQSSSQCTEFTNFTPRKFRNPEIEGKWKPPSEIERGREAGRENRPWGNTSISVALHVRTDWFVSPHLLIITDAFRGVSWHFFKGVWC